MQHEFLDDDLRDQAALFVLDSMPEQESRAYRLHLPQCEVCRREVESLARAARDLALLGPVEKPEPALWNRVLERIRRDDPRLQPDRPDVAALDVPASDETALDETAIESAASTQIWKGWAALTQDTSRDPFTFLGARDGAFEPTAVAGIEARKLFVDAENDRVTMLVRMAPGASYPGHVHGGPEECFVLSGDLQIGGLHMRSGDFQRSAAGSTHCRQSTEAGCLLLIVSSLHDEIL